ncbi:MAG: sel1 repeat family protein [Elusimicrobia bacterium]|nr:sel1 repeat family protein [Elusimicrobiota bacterium]
MTCACLLALLLSAAPAQAQTDSAQSAAAQAAPEQTAAEKRAAWLKRKAEREEANRLAAEKRAGWLKRKAEKEEANRLAAEKRADWLRRKAAKDAGQTAPAAATAQTAAPAAVPAGTTATAPAQAATPEPAPVETEPQAQAATPEPETAAPAAARKPLPPKKAAAKKRSPAKNTAARNKAAGKKGKLTDLSDYAQEVDREEASTETSGETATEDAYGGVTVVEDQASAAGQPSQAAKGAVAAASAAPGEAPFPVNYKPVPGWDQAVSVALDDSGAKKYSQALARISTLTAAGYPPALTAAGKISLARGDYDSALSFTRAAASKNYLPALLDMAGYCFKGLPGELDKNEQDGLSWLARAANEGYVPAMTQLAEARRDGLYGTEPDPAAALGWYVKAAMKGDALSEYFCGMAYKNGYGTAPDMDQAVKWLLRAAGRKNGKAMAALGYLYKEGLGVEQDYDKALYYFKAGDINGDPQGLFALGQMYEQGLGVQQDAPTAARYYEAAGNAGYREAFTQLANSCYNAKDYPCAIRYYERCGRDGDPFCQYRMCLMYWASQSMGAQSVASAYAWCAASVQMGGGDEPQRLFYQISNYNFLSGDQLAAARTAKENILKSSREFNARRKQVEEGKLPPGILKYKPLPEEAAEDGNED